MHDKFVGDTLAAWACIRLDRLQRGYRFVHLFDAKGIQTKGVILAKIDCEWKIRRTESSPSGSNAVATSGQQIKLPLR